MKPPRVVKLRDLRKLFGRYNISLGQGRKHYMLRSADRKKKHPIPRRKEGADIE